jgi:hypothetical protein
MTPAIFINHRDSDTAWATYLDRQLSTLCGHEQVFRGRSVRLGQVYPTELLEKARSAKVMLVIIGADWQEIADDTDGAVHREGDDRVRREIAEALSHDVTVIPIVVDGAQLPNNLPDDISGVLVRQHLELDHRNDDEAFTDLLGELIHILPKGVVKTPTAAARLLSSTSRLALATLVIAGLSGGAAAGITLALTRPATSVPAPPLFAGDKEWEIEFDPSATVPGTPQRYWDLDADRQPPLDSDIDFSVACLPDGKNCPHGAGRMFAVQFRADNGAQAITLPASGKPADCINAEYPAGRPFNQVPILTDSSICVRSPTRIAHLAFTRVPVGTDSRLIVKFHIEIWDRR